MFKLIKELFGLLTPSQRKRFYALQVLVIIMVFTEIVGIASIAPFMALVGDVSLLEHGGLLANIYQYTGIKSPYDFILWSGGGVLLALTLSALISMLTTWKLAMFAAEVGTENADRLYEYYLNQEWLFHAKGSSSELVKQIANESIRVTDLIILPLILMNAKIVLIFFMLVALVMLNPLVAISFFVVFTILYMLLFFIARKRLSINGRVLSEVATLRFRLMNEAFGGIKDVILLNRKQALIDRFAASGEEFAYARGNNHVLWQVPRYFMELLAFGAMIGLVLYLLVEYEGELGMVLPILSVYALAGFKLLPAFQQVYSSIGQIKGNIAAFNAIREDLIDSKEIESRVSSTQQDRMKLNYTNSIGIENVSFTYPNKASPILNNLTLKIPINSIVGIIGPSGSGKSTIVDLLMGLIDPTKGQVKVDNISINHNNKRKWQNLIGFVPQSIFLSEGSIAENVAFGIPEKEINLDQVNKALSLAHMEELVKSLDKGIHTKVGERGVQLSGGQRQRIGIARALYYEANVLIFDEATSALDGITEKIIMDAIHDFSGQKTIIMIAHRLKTVQKCDTIFMIDQGQLSAQGTYEELLKNNEEFKKMVEYA